MTEQQYTARFLELMEYNSQTNAKRFKFLENILSYSDEEVKQLDIELTKESEYFCSEMDKLSEIRGFLSTLCK